MKLAFGCSLCFLIAIFSPARAGQCWDEVTRTYIEGGDQTCWAGRQGNQQPCATFLKKKRGFYLCAQRTAVPQACESRKYKGSRVELGRGEAYKGMWYTCKIEDYSGGECNKEGWPHDQCDLVWEVTGCMHEGVKYEENGNTWTLPRRPFFYHCAKDDYGNLSKQTAGCITRNGERVRIGHTETLGSGRSRCVKQPNGAVALLIST